MAGLQAGMATATGLLNAFKNSVGNLAFGFQNMGTAGTIGMDAIKQGVVGLGGVFLALGAIVAVAAAAVAIGLGVQAVRAAGDFQQNCIRTWLWWAPASSRWRGKWARAPNSWWALCITWRVEAITGRRVSKYSG